MITRYITLALPLIFGIAPLGAVTIMNEVDEDVTIEYIENEKTTEQIIIKPKHSCNLDDARPFTLKTHEKEKVISTHVYHQDVIVIVRKDISRNVLYVTYRYENFSEWVNEIPL